MLDGQFYGAILMASCVMGFCSSYQLDLVELTQVITQTDRDRCCDIWYADDVTAGMLCWMMQCGR